jgi:hypothetical protein
MSTLDAVSACSPPRHHVALYCTLLLVVLQLFSQTLAFVPLLEQGTFRFRLASSRLKSAVEIDASVSADKWLKEQIEHNKKLDGSSVVDDTCVVGPKHVLVYDTTLRGTSYS